MTQPIPEKKMQYVYKQIQIARNALNDEEAEYQAAQEAMEARRAARGTRRRSAREIT